LKQSIALTQPNRSTGAYLTVILTWIVVNALTLIPSGPYGRLIGSTVLFCLLPGSLIVSFALTRAAANRNAPPWPEVLLLGSAVSYLVTTLVTLLLGYVPTPITYPALLAVCDMIVLVTLVLSYRRRLPLWSPITLGHRKADYAALVALVLIVLLAAYVRLGNVGYAEYLGDEADVVYRARQAIVGNQNELFLNRKGPVQIMVTAAFALGTNSFDELALRFPFALASLLSVAALYLLGSTAWNRRIGLLAAAVLAIDGVAVGFSRLVQYQGVVLLTLVLIIYCLHRSSRLEDAGLRRRYISLALILFGLVLLTHYEAAMIAIPMAMLLVHDRRLWLNRENLKELTFSMTIVLALLAVFYIPFVLHPHFSQTTDVYTHNRIGWGEGPFNNISRYVASSIFYNSTYYVALTALLWGLGALVILKRAVPARWLGVGYAAIGVAALGIALSLIAPELLSIEERSWAFACLAPVLILAIFCSSQQRMEQAALAWLFTNFIAYAFLIKVPGLHYYTMAPGAALVAALGLDWALSSARLRQSRTIHWAAWTAGTAGYALMAGYLYLAFIQTNPQYAVEFPAHRSPLYWTPQTDIPDGGFFGFPRKTGWKVLSMLYRQGELRGTYTGNRKQVKPEWTYTREPVQPDSDPRYFLFDESSSKLVINEKYPIEWVEERYNQIGQVRVEGVTQMRIFERKGVGPIPPARTYDAEPYEAAYHQIDWLDEYRHDVRYGLSEADVAALSQYLDGQRDAAVAGIVVLNDPALAVALNYYYAGPTPSAILPLPWSDSGLEHQIGGSPKVTLAVLSGVNDEATVRTRRWLSDRYISGQESTFGRVSAITFKRP
jgi:4-amino-4-deoxy-L-arabinose transferase-like glycosyltransferase